MSTLELNRLDVESKETCAMGLFVIPLATKPAQSLAFK